MIKIAELKMRCLSTVLACVLLGCTLNGDGGFTSWEYSGFRVGGRGGVRLNLTAGRNGTIPSSIIDSILRLDNCEIELQDISQEDLEHLTEDPYLRHRLLGNTDDRIASAYVGDGIQIALFEDGTLAYLFIEEGAELVLSSGSALVFPEEDDVVERILGQPVYVDFVVDR